VSGFTANLLIGLADHISTHSVGVWKASGAYQASDTAIVLGTIPQTPEKIIALTSYQVDESPALSTGVVGVQVRTRWSGQNPTLVDDLDDSIFSLLHGATHLHLSTGVHVVQALRNSSTSLGQDANGRWERASNYYLTVHRPSPNRL
jgi:hypothetical protein